MGLWALLALPAQALMIGAPQSRAELGRTLQMQIPVQLDRQEELPLACVQAQAQSGEFGGGVGPLVISAKPAADGLMVSLRSQQPLREPVVIVRLHLACQYQRTQIYTLLVDPPAPELPMTSGSAVGAPAAAVPPKPTSTAVAAGPTQADTMPTPAAHSAPASKAAAVPRTVPGRASPPSASHRHAAPTAQPQHGQHPAARPEALRAAAQSRLELDDPGAADWSASPQLRLAVALHATLPSLSPEQRSQLNQLRQLIMDATAAPGQAQPTLQQIEALQARATVLQRQFEQASQQLQRSQAELARVRAQSYAPSVVYALIAGIILLAALSLWLWRRGADPGLSLSPFEPGSVRGRHAAEAASSAAEQDGTTPVAALSVQASTIQPPVMPFGLPPLVDGRPVQPEIDAPSPLDPLPPQSWGHSGFDWDSRFMQPLSQDKQVHVDELMDAGHLAEYFIEMGDDDRAMALLEKSLDDSASDSFALPYLLLFELYRKHGRKKEFEALYTRFERRFNVAVPPWGDPGATQASAQGRDLLDYDRAMKLITMTWGEPQIVTVLERMLLDDPHQHRMGFDLAAYRDLLTLYAVARDLFPDVVPTQTQVEHVELSTQPTLNLDFELPLDIAPEVKAAPATGASEFKLVPRNDAEGNAA